MNEAFVTHMQGAIASAPNAKIAQQLETLLYRLQATGGEVPELPGLPNAPADANQPGEDEK